MLQGKTIQEVAQLIEDGKARARDYVIDSRALQVRSTPVETRLEMPGFPTGLAVLPNAHRQIAARLKVPHDYYERCRTRAPELFDAQVNHWLNAEPEQRMLRTWTRGSGEGDLRAYLSDRYRRFDNWQVAESILPVISEQPELQFASTNISEDHLYVKVVFPRITAEVKPGDIVQMGLSISNSEVGLGTTLIEELIFRLVCFNGAVIERAARRHHVGRHITGGNGDTDDVLELFADETVRADDKAFQLKLRDVVRAHLTEEHFGRTVARLQDAAKEIVVTDPVKTVKELSKRASLADSEGNSILKHLATGGDMSRWGLMNAVTRASQDTIDYERATELERLGGRILDLDLGTKA